MTGTATTAGLPLSRYPQPDRAAISVPPHIAQILLILDILLRYALSLAGALDRLATLRSFSIVARGFGTANLPRIAATLRRGTRRILALQRVLHARAAAGRDLRPMPPRIQVPAPRAPSETAPGHAADTTQPARAPHPPGVSADPLAVDPPELFDADARRRPVGRVMADICRDLGLSPAICAPLFWNATFEAIWFHRGGFNRYATDMRQRAKRFEQDVDRRPDLDWPEMDADSIRRILGGLVGEQAFAPANPPAVPPPEESPPAPDGEAPEQPSAIPQTAPPIRHAAAGQGPEPRPAEPRPAGPPAAGTCDAKEPPPSG